MKPESRLESITPDMARHFLTLNKKNRKINKQRVEILTREMKRGDWKVTNQGIGFDVDGNLVDGQQRLTSIVKANMTIDMFITLGLPVDSMDVIDTSHKGRTCGDLFSMRGELNSSVLAAGTRLVYQFLPNGKYSSYRNAVSQPELDRTLEAFPQLREWASFSTGMRSLRGMLAPSAIVGLGALFSETPEETITGHDFFTHLKSGVDLQENDPILLLRNILIKNMSSKNRLGHRYQVWLTVKAWNAVNEHRDIKQLAIKYKESFPEIFGLDIDVHV